MLGWQKKSRQMKFMELKKMRPNKIEFTSDTKL